MKFVWTLLTLALLVNGSLAQGVRSLGLGGLILPGPAAAYLNPAYAAFPAGRYGSDSGFSLPMGLLGLLVRPEANFLRYFYDRAGFASAENGFDLLTFYDQTTHLNQFLINPAQSPLEVIFDFSNPADIKITDQNGRRLNFDFSLGAPSGISVGKALTPTPLFVIPLDLIPDLSMDFGLFAGNFGLGLTPDANLRRLATTRTLESNTPYGVEARMSSQAGLSLGFTYATALPNLLLSEGMVANVYLGSRGEGFYGLGYLEADINGTVTTDANRVPSQNPTLGGRVFYSYPGAGFGYGIRADAGVALEFDQTTIGLGIRNVLGFAQWHGLELDLSASNPTPQASQRSSFGFVPAFFLNAATHVSMEVGSTIVGADLGYDGSLFGHLGAEYLLGPARLRAGVGYEGGLKFGLGAGFSGPGFTLDAALTTHPAPVVGGQVFGIAVSLGFVF